MLFTSFTGNGVEGTNTITRTGNSAWNYWFRPWKCTDVGKAGENFCNQSLNFINYPRLTIKGNKYDPFPYKIDLLQNFKCIN